MKVLAGDIEVNKRAALKAAESGAEAVRGLPADVASDDLAALEGDLQAYASVGRCLRAH